MYYQEVWLGYLSSVIVQKCIKLARERCPGCAKKFKSALLHLHEQLSLENKLECYFEEVRGLLVSKMGFYYAEFERKMSQPCSEVIKKLYLDFGKTFLFMATPKSIYYGRYIDESNCELIHSKNFLQDQQSTSAEEPTTSAAGVPEVIAIQNYPPPKKQKLQVTDDRTQEKGKQKQSKVARKKQLKIGQCVPSSVMIAGDYRPSSPTYALSEALLEAIDDLSDFE